MREREKQLDVCVCLWERERGSWIIWGRCCKKTA